MTDSTRTDSPAVTATPDLATVIPRLKPLDMEEAGRLLHAIHPNGGGYMLVQIVPEDDRLDTAYMTADGETLTEALHRLTKKQRERRGIGVYYGFGELAKRPAKRGTEADVVRVGAAWADVDAKTAEGFDPALKPARLEKLRAFTPAPSIIIDTGGGFQPTWLLSAPADVRGVEMRARVRAVNAALARLLAGDATIDLARVFRLPGTWNTKAFYPAKHPGYVEAMRCSIVEMHEDRRYTLAELEALVTDADRDKAAKTKGSTATTTTTAPGPLTDEDKVLIERMKAAANGEKFKALWDGDTSGRKSASEADVALCCHLAFWTGKDAGRIDRLFRASKLMRPKWDREDYRARTITKAIELTREVYTGRNADAIDEHLTDLGNALRLARLRGNDLLYVGENDGTSKTWQAWLTWDGRRWRIDSGRGVELMTDAVLHDLIDTSAAIRKRAATAAAEAMNAGGAEAILSSGDEAEDAEAQERRERIKTLHLQAKAFDKWSKQSEGRTRIEATVALARARVRNINHAVLDRDPWALNVVNGTLDLRTGELRPHRPGDLLTTLCPIEYDPKATAPTFERFLLEIMDGKAHLVEYLRRLLGYATTGDVREQELFFLHGGGANGKSTLLGAIRDTLGDDYAMEAPPDLLVKKGDAHVTERAALFGKRFVSTVEVEEGRQLAEVLVKQLTGGDKMTARRMREDFWSFDPSHKLFLAANHKPEIRGTDEAIWRRVKLLPFIVSFEGRADKELPEKLRAERAGILAWLVRGAVEWFAGGLNHPPEVEAASSEYRAESDPIGDFIDECCDTGTDIAGLPFSVKAGLLYEAFAAWFKRERGGEPMTGTAFGRRIAAKFPKEKGRDGRLYSGLKLRPDHGGEGGDEVTF